MIKPGTPQRGARERRQVSRVNRFGSYCPDEVVFLVKDLSGALAEVSRADYEQGIDEGRHYAEMLPDEEFRPTAEALDLFDRALQRSAQRLALAVGIATEHVLVRRGPRTVLVSLCQTGTPVGILLRRWAKWQDVLWLAARRSVPVEERFDLRYACVGLMQAPASHSVRDAPENRAEETGTDR